MAQSSIEWTEETWNPVVGCTRKSAGCDLCYAVTMTRRLEAMGQVKYAGLVNRGKGHFNGVVRTYDEALSKPLSRQRGTIYFVNSMADLFHPEVTFDFAAAVFGIMGATPRHQYQVLTKRPERAAEFFDWLGTFDDPAAEVSQRASEHTKRSIAEGPSWPLPNVWMGTSVEEQEVVERIGALQRIPATVRFLSCEPLIGELDLEGKLGGIHWVIVGGESGPGARPMEKDWARAIHDACQDASVPFFFKQTGRVLSQEWGLGPSKGSDEEAWPDEHRDVAKRAFPEIVAA